MIHFLLFHYKYVIMFTFNILFCCAVDHDRASTVGKRERILTIALTFFMGLFIVFIIMIVYEAGIVNFWYRYNRRKRRLARAKKAQALKEVPSGMNILNL